MSDREGISRFLTWQEPVWCSGTVDVLPRSHRRFDSRSCRILELDLDWGGLDLDWDWIGYIGWIGTRWTLDQ
jgi:hypothetical protein